MAEHAVDTTSNWPAREVIKLRIVALAQGGKAPAVIADEMKLPVATIYNALRQARSNGIVIPVFHTHSAPQRAKRPTRAGEDVKPAPMHKPSAARQKDWTFQDDQTLTELMARNVRLTGIAALMRHPYAAIIAAADRLGLARAGVSS